MSTRRPDVMAVEPNGKVHAIELASKTDVGSRFRALQMRNDQAMRGLPAQSMGEIFTFKHPYNASEIKSVLDSFISSL